MPEQHTLIQAEFWTRPLETPSNLVYSITPYTLFLSSSLSQKQTNKQTKHPTKTKKPSNQTKNPTDNKHVEHKDQCDFFLSTYFGVYDMLDFG